MKPTTTTNVAPEALADGVNAEAETFAEHGVTRKLFGGNQLMFMGVALAFSSYQLFISAFPIFPSIAMRSWHLGFLLTLAFILYPLSKHGKKSLSQVPLYDWGIALVALAMSFYHYIFEIDLVARSGDPNTMDLIFGSAIIVLVFEGTRRIMGLALPIVCAIFLAYGFFGQYLPGELAHRGYDFGQIINQLTLGTDGILGTPLWVSTTYIFLFILFGAFLEHAGMINLFNSVALGFVGQAVGGPAKVAVVSSGFMGTISGSGVANVLTVGQFTIPLMKRFGYSPVFAGAVEATSSMGGQIMPPVMGAVAFIMAETLGVPYADIVKAAIIPAILYYFTAFWMVHLEAKRLNLLGLPKEECPNPWKAIASNWYLALPLAILVVMLFEGAPPYYAGMVGISTTVIMILAAAIAARISTQAFRYVFWVGTGLLTAKLISINVPWVFILIAVLVGACFWVKGGRKTLQSIRNALIDGARQALPVGMACAIVGIIIGVLTLTGAASSFAGFVLEVGKTSLFLSLVLTMLVCLVLGMGIPTIPNYIITSAIAAPALLKLGVPLIVSHMFVFYFGIMADLTPPVALAAFAAASIAKASPMKIGIKAVQVAVAGFIIPYMAVYDPLLMLQGKLSVVGVAYIVGKAVLAIVLWGATSIGYLRTPLNAYERLWAFAAACLMVSSVKSTDELGLAAAAGFLIWALFFKKAH